MDLKMLSRLFPKSLLWKKDINSIYLESNSLCASMFGYKRPEEVVGVRDEDIPCKISELAEIFQKHDREVISTGRSKRVLEVLQTANNVWKIFLVTKNPLLDQDRQIVGTSAYSIDITKPFIALNRGFTNIPINNHFQSSYIVDNYFGESELSPRQSVCLFYLLHGKTIKQIGKLLNISPRTVETHLEKLKLKFNCRTKGELIDQALSQKFDTIIPEFLFKQQLAIELD